MTTIQTPEVEYAKLGAEIVKAHSEFILRGLAAVGAKAASEIKYRFTDVFSSYLLRASESYSKTKTVLYRNAAVPLYSFYVPLDLATRDGPIRAADIQSLSTIGKHVIVTGLAGTGKSTFLKHIFLSAIVTRHSIPIFIELRRLNALQHDLSELILQTVQDEKLGLTQEYLERTFRAGKCTLLLDAYDEINLDRRDSVKRSIFQLSERFPDLRIVLTSRPDDSFVAWNSFVELQAMKLSKQQALALIDKLNYDLEVKSRFIQALGRSLYDEHESFLSNPLLLTIMLMTYRENAEIPKKRHLFFAQVFQTLYSQHDALKEGYKRELYSALAMDDFQKVLAAFSIQSYLHGELTFGRDGALKYLAKAKEMTNLKFGTEEYLEDLLKSVCFLIQDGLFLSYTHKQFQEYYAGVFVTTAPAPKQKQLIERIAPGFIPNDVIRILFEMSPSIVERCFVLPGIKRLLKEIGCDGEAKDPCYCKFLTLAISHVSCSHGALTYTIASISKFEFVRFIISAYSSSVSLKRPSGSGASMREMLEKRAGGATKHIRFETSNVSEDASALRVFKGHSFFGIEYLKYLIDVRDFVTMRLKAASTSLDELLM